MGVRTICHDASDIGQLVLSDSCNFLSDSLFFLFALSKDFVLGV